MALVPVVWSTFALVVGSNGAALAAGVERVLAEDEGRDVHAGDHLARADGEEAEPVGQLDAQVEVLDDAGRGQVERAERSHRDGGDADEREALTDAEVRGDE